MSGWMGTGRSFYEVLDKAMAHKGERHCDKCGQYHRPDDDCKWCPKCGRGRIGLFTDPYCHKCYKKMYPNAHIRPYSYTSKD